MFGKTQLPTASKAETMFEHCDSKDLAASESQLLLSTYWERDKQKKYMWIPRYPLVLLVYKSLVEMVSVTSLF